jgi:hypothetical protein
VQRPKSNESEGILMYTLDVARAHIRDLQRDAARESTGIDLGRAAGRLRRLVARKRVDG